MDARIDPRLAGLLAPIVCLGAVPAAAVAADDLPDTITVTGIVRDFKEKTVSGGHPDFENRPDRGFGRYSGNVALTLGDDRKPVFTGGGFKIASEWRDSEYRQICPFLYDPALGDTAGSYSHPSTGGITSAATFGQWFNDVPGVNLSAPLSLTLVRQEDGQYVFDDRYDPVYGPLGGFFPIDGQLFGNSGGNPDHNFHFTFELHLAFEYDASADQFFQFIGDDDVWIFIDDRLVVDLGGVHAAHDQFVDMDRLGLVDGETYSIGFFFAERFRPYSNFRIETNIPVREFRVPSVTNAFD